MSDSKPPPDDSAWNAGAGLWLQLFGELPPVRCELSLLFDVLLKQTKPAGPYCLEHKPAAPDAKPESACGLREAFCTPQGD